MYFLVCCNTTTVIFQQWKDGKKLGVAAKNLWKRMCQRTWQDYFGVKKRRYEAFLDVQVVTHKSARSCFVTNRHWWLQKWSGSSKTRQYCRLFHLVLFAKYLYCILPVISKNHLIDQNATIWFFKWTRNQKDWFVLLKKGDKAFVKMSILSWHTFSIVTYVKKCKSAINKNLISLIKNADTVHCQWDKKWKGLIHPL